MKKWICLLVFLSILLKLNTCYASSQPNYLKVDIVEEVFLSDLNKKFKGCIYHINNSYSAPIKIKTVETFNSFSPREAATEVNRSLTPLGATLSVISGALAIPTLGISTVLILPATYSTERYNIKSRKEANQFYSYSHLEEQIIEPNQEVTIKTIIYKSNAINKQPSIRVQYQLTDTNEWHSTSFKFDDNN